MVVLNQQPASSPARRSDRPAHRIARALLRRAADTRNGVRPGAQLCPTACPTGPELPMAEPNRAGIIIRVSGVRVPPPASRPRPCARLLACRAAVMTSEALTRAAKGGPSTLSSFDSRPRSRRVAAGGRAPRAGSASRTAGSRDRVRRFRRPRAGSRAGVRCIGRGERERLRRSGSRSRRTSSMRRWSSRTELAARLWRPCLAAPLPGCQWPGAAARAAINRCGDFSRGG